MDNMRIGVSNISPGFRRWFQTPRFVRSVNTSRDVGLQVQIAAERITKTDESPPKANLYYWSVKLQE